MVTQPARRQGRGRVLRQPPVAEWASERGLELAQPDDVRVPEFLDSLRRYRPTTAVVVAFGQIFPAELLAIPDQGCINVHASLLPRYRGAAPIQAAIIAGDRVTGITTMLMDEGLDTGPILLQETLEIGAEETAGELAERLADLGARLLISTLVGRDAGEITPRPQPKEGSSVARRLRRRDGIIDWSLPAPRIFDLLRGLTPWPGVATQLRGASVKVLRGRVAAAMQDPMAEPGTYLGLHDDSLLVACGRGTGFAIERLQKAGRKPVSGRAFANGERLALGERFG